MSYITEPWVKQVGLKYWRLLEELLRRTDLLDEFFDVIVPYYEENGLITSEGLWGDKNPDGTSRGPVPHSIVVAAAQWVLGKKMQLGADHLKTLVLAGLLHDANKRKEIEGSLDTDHAFAELTEMFDFFVATLAFSSGHAAMPRVLQRIGDTRHQIVFLVDNMVTGTTLGSVSVKCDYLDEAAKSGRYPYNDDGIAIYGVPYFTFQRNLATTFEARMAFVLGVGLGLPSGTPVSQTNDLYVYLIQSIAEEFGVDLSP